MDASRIRLGVACAGALWLAACGGGGSSSPTGGGSAPPRVDGTDVPVSATTSADGAFDFVAVLAASQDDTGDPLVLGNAVPATSETDEPRALR